MKFLLPITYAFFFVAAKTVEPVAVTAAQHNISVAFFHVYEFEETCKSWLKLFGWDDKKIKESYDNFDIRMFDGYTIDYLPMVAEEILHMNEKQTRCAVDLIIGDISKRRGAVILLPGGFRANPDYDITQEVIKQFEKEYILPAIEKMKKKKEAESK